VSAWTYDPAFDPQDYAAIVYRIELPSGQFYIGKKAIWVLKAGKIVRPSDWQDYWGSSKDVKALVKIAGKATCKREVLHFCVSRGEASWLEACALIKGDCMLDPLCLNGNVLTNFNHKVVKGYSNDDRRERYLKDIAKQKSEAGLNSGGASSTD
jgi:hypothetical protein